VAAKTLGVAPQCLFTWLERNAWTYRRGRHLVPYQDKIHAGLLDHKFITITHKDKTKEDLEQTVITRKGLAKLAQMIHGKARA
jgi:anti-repressor protein